jgi:hypothetical protein
MIDNSMHLDFFNGGMIVKWTEDDKECFDGSGSKQMKRQMKESLQ